MHSDTLPIREPCCNFADNTSEIDALNVYKTVEIYHITC